MANEPAFWVDPCLTTLANVARSTTPLNVIFGPGKTILVLGNEYNTPFADRIASLLNGSVLVVMRTEHDRRCFIGVYTSEDKAKAAIQDDIQEHDGLYDVDDYDILPGTLDL